MPSAPASAPATLPVGYVSVPLSVALAGSASGAAGIAVIASASGYASATSTGTCSGGSCSLTVTAPPAYTSLAFTITAANGATLDSGSAAIEADDVTGIVPSFCFGCTPSSVTLSVNPAALPVGKAGTATVDALAYDAQGRRIIGSAAYVTPIQLTTSDPSATLSQSTLTTPSQALTLSYSGANVPSVTVSGSLSGTAVTPATIAMDSAAPITEPGGAVIGDAGIDTAEQLAAIPTAPPLPPATGGLAIRIPMAAAVVDLSSYFPPVANQTTTNMCTVFSGVYSIMSALVGAVKAPSGGWSLVGNGQWGNNPYTTFSPRFTYNQRSVNNGIDDGSQLSYVFESLKTIGAVPLSVVPYAPTDSPSVSYLTNANLAVASNYRLSVYYNVGNNVTMMKQYLAAGFPLYIGMMMDDGMSKLTSSNYVYSAYDGSTKGGHAMVIVGYDDSVAGGSFKVLNSWSASYALGGYFYIPYSFWANGVIGGEALAART